MIQRLLSVIYVDLRLQARNGFYHAVAFVLIIWAIVVSQLPSLNWVYLMPAVLLGNLLTVSFYFIGGLILLEKSEGTLEAQVVSPLTDGEYLASKLITLCALSLFESLVMVWTAVGSELDLLPMAAGIASASVLYSLAGFLAVSRYDSINEYIFPSVLYVVVLQLPYLHYFGLWESQVLYIHPLQGPLVLMSAAFVSASEGLWGYGLGCSVAWIILAFLASRRAFQRFVVLREGAGVH